MYVSIKLIWSSGHSPFFKTYVESNIISESMYLNKYLWFLQRKNGWKAEKRSGISEQKPAKDRWQRRREDNRLPKGFFRFPLKWRDILAGLFGINGTFPLTPLLLKAYIWCRYFFFKCKQINLHTHFLYR